MNRTAKGPLWASLVSFGEFDGVGGDKNVREASTRDDRCQRSWKSSGRAAYCYARSASQWKRPIHIALLNTGSSRIGQ